MIEKMLDSVTFRFTQTDGSVIDETVSLDFADVPTEVFAQVVKECDPEDELGMTAVLVHSRLSDPELATPEMLRDLFVQMQQGEGVTTDGR